MAYVFRRYILLLTFLPCLCVADAQRPVTVDFSVQRKDAQTVVLLAKVKVQKGVQLFTTDKKTGKEFVSSLLLDSTIAKYSRPVREEGILLHHYDSAVSGDLHYFQDSVTLQQLISLPDTSSIGMIKGTYSWLAKDDEGFPSGDTAFSVIIEKGGNGDVSKGLTVAGAQDVPDSAWHIFAICFLAGLVMVFTPCVFPLIPVTVSFFLKKSRNRADGIRNAVWYSVSIILIYTVPTFIITLLFGETAMYRIATSVAANILFFVVFVLFAVSFFGAFELTLPHKWANKADEKANKGGILGIFFMALTLVIVSFSCTGPIVGTLLAQVSGTNAIMAPVMGMLGLSAGLAIPFSLFAFFPTMLQALPKSGGWLNSVKVVFGFVELALALKFLSNVDLIYGWHLLDREIFLTIWIVLSAMTGFYLLGKIKFSHDSDLQYVSIPRIFFAITAFCFGVYLFPGLWGAPLGSMSGLLPPVNTLDFNLNDLQYKIGQPTVSSNIGTNAAAPPKLYTDKLHDAPFGLTTYYDLDEGMAAAKAWKKPIMLDFTGHSCTNCRKMENEVWSNAEVLQRLKNDFVIISLYVDENSDLPPSQVYTNAQGKQIITLAQKSRDYETTHFGILSQPLYMFIDTNGNVLNKEKYGYDPDAAKFVKHLDNVKAAWGK